ncbi:ABC transporter permease [Rhodohalobacter sulfatireducens]|uniref:FtsX-like permease family protein n=1 Tax=Rhodohalobacter sulfatireducens TaxID=2911366 RepID=A0ABS9KFI4_9BACT|nr:FtsX-like permease family protein [Rhodohalobacter sulfatireducens]MCG2589575.1 FtsX-like permease family protein [Rhodohalobacter sulfatireducens]
MFVNILKLGWKNVWRNPARSGVVIIAVLLGTWAGIFSAGFFNGMLQDYLHKQIELSIGHMQVEHPQFGDLYNPKYSVSNSNEIVSYLEAQPYTREISAKSIATGLAQSPHSSFGVTINGIDVEADTSLAIEQYITEGEMIDTTSRNPILIGIELAERLDLELRSRMVLSFQDVTGEITGGAFRVAGIFDSFIDQFDESTVFVLQSDLNRLLGNMDAIHNIRVDMDDLATAEMHAEEIEQAFPGVLVKTWRDIAPDLRYTFDMMDLTLYIVMIIIIIGLVFSIINTMLMAVLERTRELGMLRAIGMNKSRTFSMVMIETVFLTMVGAPGGLLLSWLCITYFGNVGIDLSAFAQGLNQYGIGTVVYPSLTWSYYLNIMLMIALAALLSALYPAWRTLKLKPVQAIRKFN